MSAAPVIRKSFEKVGTEWMVSTTPLFTRSRLLRQSLLRVPQKYIQVARTHVRPNFPCPAGVTEDLTEFSTGVWNTVDRILDHNLSRPVIRDLVPNLVCGIMVEGGQQTEMAQLHETQGTKPPGFLSLRPGKACNLHCTGCYTSAGKSGLTK